MGEKKKMSLTCTARYKMAGCNFTDGDSRNRVQTVEDNSCSKCQSNTSEKDKKNNKL